MVKEEEDGDTLAHIYLEGLEIINTPPIDQTKYKPSTIASPSRDAMIIHTGKSDDSMSGISLDSKSTLGSVHWNK